VSRLTLRLPETLHQQLAHLAENEGVSLDQYIVYALTRQATLVHGVQVVPEVEVEQQKQAFQSLLRQLERVLTSELESVLAAREQVDAEVELNPDAVARLQERIRKRA
jgi:HicB family